jgi:hypothetical protein
VLHWGPILKDMDFGEELKIQTIAGATFKKRLA